MRLLLAPLVLLLTATALSGCIQDSTLGTPLAARSAAPAGEGSGPWSDTVDLLPYLREDRVALVAFQATEDLRLDVRMDKDISYPGGGTTCSLGSLRPHAPVDYLLDVAADRDGRQPDYTPHGAGSMGGGGGGDLLAVTVEGEPVFHSDDTGVVLGSHASSGRIESSMDLARGEWLLVTVGLYGVDPESLDADSAWTVRLDATAALERKALPSARLACGLGFDDHARTRAAGVSVDPSASASWSGDYAANLRVLTFDGEADGYFEFSHERIPLAENMDVHRFAWGGGSAGFQVADPGDAWVFWVFQGV